MGSEDREAFDIKLLEVRSVEDLIGIGRRLAEAIESDLLLYGEVRIETHVTDDVITFSRSARD